MHKGFEATTEFCTQIYQAVRTNYFLVWLLCYAVIGAFIFLYIGHLEQSQEAKQPAVLAVPDTADVVVDPYFASQILYDLFN